ncbi:hypothetical protein [Virgibacillus doumboii]|uniref:hypothetical protein n=1 Tax=Virgibacillus doumboii TaxID=2697503 RepID=UPI0013E0E1C6|nr:hypothetical protein [Virgibacillus doumboii]
MANKPEPRLLKNLRIIEKHLAKNEKWLQYPEKKMHHFEREMDVWNKEFLSGISNVEKMIHELEKRME